MKFLVAQLKKDVVLARWLLGGWAACVAVCLWASAQPTSPASGTTPGWMGFTMLCLIVLPLLGIALVVRTIQEDSLADEGAFWRTRPISRLGLLGAKTLLLVPLFAVSIAVQAPLWGHTFVAPSWETATAFFVGTAAFASVTSNFGRALGTFLLVSLGVGVAVGIVHGLTNASVTVNAHSWSTHLAGLPGLGGSEKALSTALFLIGFPLVLIHQYQTLRTRTSLGMLAGILALAALL